MQDDHPLMKRIKWLWIAEQHRHADPAFPQMPTNYDAPLHGASADTISNVSARWTDLNETLLHESSSAEAAHYGFLESLHVFVLAHVTRRPIIVFGRHDQRAGAANMRGIYLPSLLPTQQCSNPSPLLLMYDANHFQPVITVEGAYNLPLSDQFGSLPFRYHESAICECVLRLNRAGTHCDTAYVHQGFAQLLCSSVSSKRFESEQDSGPVAMSRSLSEQTLEVHIICMLQALTHGAVTACDEIASV